MDVVLKFVLRLFGVLVRGLVWLYIESGVSSIVWYTGWPICRAVSIGYFPDVAIHKQVNATRLSSFLVGISGLAMLIAVGTLLAIFVVEFAV